jgi:hypothetical protein
MSEFTGEEVARFLRWEGSTQVLFGVPLTAYCLYEYGICRVTNLAEKGFHFPMFLMLFFCGLLYTMGGALLLGVGITMPNDQDYYKTVAYKLSVGAISTAWGLNYFLHTQFITKYWTMSRRVESILLNQDSRPAVRCGIAMNLFLSFLSVLVLIMNWVVLWGGKFHYGLPVRATDGALLCITPVLLFALLLSAFLKLNSLADKSAIGLSMKEVAVMLIANGVYALLDPLTWIFSPVTIGLKWYTGLIVVSYASLLLGLIQVTNMMCKLVDIQRKAQRFRSNETTSKNAESVVYGNSEANTTHDVIENEDAARPDEQDYQRSWQKS